jgi:ABC-2 type transport system ATP-binding protein
MTARAMIEVERLGKRYGAVEALRDVSFRVDEGDVVGFLGPNGAGKTTTLRILAGFLAPSSGRVRVAGIDVTADRVATARRIGYMPEATPLYPEMRVGEYLAFRAALKRVPRRTRRREVARVLEAARVADVSDMLIGHLSKGYRQRVGLADALVGSPPVLILDEPTSGLDPNQIRETRALVRSLAGAHTVLLSTHILPEVEAVCRRVLVIARGRLVAAAPIAELRRGARAAVEIEVGGELDAALAILRAQKDVLRAEPLAHVERALSVELDPARLAGDDGGLGAATARLLASLHAAAVPVRRAQPRATSLEEIFGELTEPTAAARDAREGGPP